MLNLPEKQARINRYRGDQRSVNFADDSKMKSSDFNSIVT